MAATPLETLLAPGFLDGLTEMPMADVRTRRAACQEVEVSLSYLRRLVQGRLDIVYAELQSRLAGEEPGNLESLVERLPTILADHVRAPGNGRLPTLMAPADADIDPALRARLDAIVDAAAVSRLSERPVEEVEDLAERLDQLEKDVSSQRRSLHERIDALQEEIVRRYKSGEASVDSLLS